MHVPPTSFYSHALLVARSISMVQCHLQILDLTAMKAYRCVARRSGWSLGWKLRWEAAGQTNLVIYVDDFQPNSITRVVTFKRKGKCDDDIIAHRQKVSHPYTLFGCIDISDSAVVDKKTTQTKFIFSYTAGH